MDRFEKVRAVFWAAAIALVAVMLFLGIRPAEAADETWLAATVTSYHFDRSIKHNEFNAGLGVEHDIAKDTRLVAGFYDNSNHHLSLYAGAAYAPIPIFGARFGVLAGGVNGYGENPRMWWFLVAPFLAVEGKTFGLNIIGAPPMLKHEGVLALQLKMKF